MSQFYDQASLVMIPSGYKTGKVYSQKPLSTDGELTFTRASSASRIAPNGLLEKVRTNLLTYSNTFSDASWTKIRATFTGGQSDPFGGTNAWKMECSTLGSVQIAKNLSLGNGSIYAKAGDVSTFNIWVGVNVTFDLSTGTITSGAANGKIESVGGGWYRCTAINASGVIFNPNFSGGALGQHVFIAFAQAEASDVATDYIATTTAAVSVGPVANLPRLDYLGGATCGKLLLEGQRTNLNTYSDNLYNAVYVKQNVTISANNTTSPSGYVDADKIVEDTANTNKNCRFPNTSLTSGTTYNVSFFAKPDNCDVIAIREGAVSGDAITYKFSTGTTSLQGTRFTSLVVTDYANGFKRISVNFLPTSTASHNFRIQLLGNAYNQTTNTNAGTYTYLGDGVSGVWAWGCTVEAGNYPTSVIPTLGAAVTRGADSASKTGISSLIGQTAGTIYAEWTANNVSTSGRILAIGDGTFANRIAILEDAGTIRLYISTSSVVQADLTSLGNYTGTHKIAVAYANNDLKVYIDGVTVVTQTSLSVPLCSVVYVGTLEDGTGATPLGGGIKQTLLFPTRLSNADLAALTA